MVTTGPRAALYLDTHGDGVADVAFGCDDVAAAHARAVAAGAADPAPEQRIRLLDHVAICLEVGDSIVVRGGSGDMTLTLVATGSGQLNPFPHRNGGRRGPTTKHSPSDSWSGRR